MGGPTSQDSPEPDPALADGGFPAGPDRLAEWVAPANWQDLEGGSPPATVLCREAFPDLLKGQIGVHLAAGVQQQNHRVRRLDLPPSSVPLASSDLGLPGQ